VTYTVNTGPRLIAWLGGFIRTCRVSAAAWTASDEQAEYRSDDKPFHQQADQVRPSGRSAVRHGNRFRFDLAATFVGK
jgi:hypothetical protein